MFMTTPRESMNFPALALPWQVTAIIPVSYTFGYDGQVLFALNTIIRNEGFGDLYLYNMDVHRAQSRHQSDQWALLLP